MTKTLYAATSAYVDKINKLPVRIEKGGEEDAVGTI